ncbi:hypothetical protein [Streptomyces sp. NPDC052042]|uniref:hypothetical protein n=1 Tax=Streptomyces sp. NPDC052042 TaxID=3365683 RepID=UPI0037D7A2CE
MKRRRWWSVIGLWAMWWVAITTVFWLLGKLLGQSASLVGCAASAVLVIVVGEIGDRIRRRFSPRREVG